jgi:hypothetical protein
MRTWDLATFLTVTLAIVVAWMPFPSMFVFRMLLVVREALLYQYYGVPNNVWYHG